LHYQGWVVYLNCAHSNPGHQVVYTCAPNGGCSTHAPDRAAERRDSERV
jgi:hypothetical protein